MTADDKITEGVIVGDGVSSPVNLRKLQEGNFTEVQDTQFPGLHKSPPALIDRTERKLQALASPDMRGWTPYESEEVRGVPVDGHPNKFNAAPEYVPPAELADQDSPKSPLSEDDEDEDPRDPPRGMMNAFSSVRVFPAENGPARDEKSGMPLVSFTFSAGLPNGDTMEGTVLVPCAHKGDTPHGARQNLNVLALHTGMIMDQFLAEIRTRIEVAAAALQAEKPCRK